MAVLAAVSVAKLEEAFAGIGFFPWERQEFVYRRESDGLMLFPDVKDGRITLTDLFQQIEVWQGEEDIVKAFVDALAKVGGPD